MKLVLPKKISWSFLILFFIFDNVVSYIAVTRMRGKEADLLIAFAVEKYPLLYFVLIPVQTVIVYFIIIGLTKLAVRVFKKFDIEEGIFEKIILTAAVIFWPIANSFMNLMFILGRRLTIPAWYGLIVAGAVTASAYFYAAAKFLSKRRSR